MARFRPTPIDTHRFNKRINNLRIGQQVRWTSGSRGRTPIVKVGIVVAVIPSRTCPYAGGQINAMRELGYTDRRISQRHRVNKGGLLGRFVESYLVAVGNQLYWPRVGRIRIPQIRAKMDPRTTQIRRISDKRLHAPIDPAPRYVESDASDSIP